MQVNAPPQSQLADDPRLRAVLDTVVDGVILIDASGMVVLFNRACEELFGYRAEEVIGQNVRMLMPEPYRGQHDGYLDNYRRTRERKIIGIGREVHGLRKDGSTFPMNLSVGETEHEGAPVFVGILHDLTERNRADQEMRDIASRLRALVDTAVDGVILIDDAGTVLVFNPACERLFGYQAEEVLGRNVRMLMPAPYATEHDGYLENYRRTGQPRIIGIGREVTGLRKDGTTFPMDLSVGRAEQDGTPIFVGILHDLTERKRTEEQLVQAQKMEAVGQLAGGIAHDFNNLLTVIVGNAELLGESLRARPDLERLAQVIAAAGTRGGELTRRLLAFSRRQVLLPVEVDCNRLVRGMHDLLRRTLREDIEMQMHLDAELWPAYADPAQLESAILNLALNAQDAMPAGGHLILSTTNLPLGDDYQEFHPEVAAGSYVMISVTDDGHGMSAEVRERVFEPFFTTKDVGKGSGLGLSMVYGLVKQSNGHVALYSEPDLGTTIRLYLPAAGDAAREDADAGAGTDRQEIPRGSERVLVVEDDPFVRAYALSCLERLGYEVIAAKDGHDALARLDQSMGVDLLFTDIVMPGGISGWDLVEKVRERYPGICVLVTSGYAVEALAAHGRLSMDQPFLNKPYRRIELAGKLREALARRRQPAP